MPDEPSTKTVLAHLAMLALAAKGEYSLKSGEIERRHAAIVSYIRTGQCVADEDDLRIIEAVKRAVKECS